MSTVTPRQKFLMEMLAIGLEQYSGDLPNELSDSTGTVIVSTSVSYGGHALVLDFHVTYREPEAFFLPFDAAVLKVMELVNSRGA